MSMGSVRGRLGSLTIGVLAAGLILSAGVVPVAAIGPVLPPTLVTVAVTPPGASVAVGATQQFTATGTYSDLSTHDVTASVNWASSDPAVATVSNVAGTKGLATGVAQGGVAVSATDPTSGHSGSTLLAVTPAPPPPVVLVTVAVTPPSASVDVGATQQFSATGTYSDLSTQDVTASVTWASSDPSVATISNAAGSRGRATGIAQGGVTITATDPVSGQSGTALLTVTPVVVPPVVTPPVVSPPSTERTITVTPSTGLPGTRVQMVGVRFPAGKRVRVSYRTGGHPRQVKICKTWIRIDGSFDCTGLIPGQPKAGAAGVHTIAAKVIQSKGTRAGLTEFRLLG